MGEAGESLPVLSCYVAQTDTRRDGPECRAALEEPLELATPEAECLLVSRRLIDFGGHATFSTGPSETMELRNHCDHPIEVVVDRQVTCDDDWVRECRQCRPEDPDCKPDFAIATDCIPAPGDESLTLEGSSTLPVPEASRCSITVEFTPQANGSRIAQKVVSTADTGEAYSIHLEGSGIGGQVAPLPEEASEWCWEKSQLDEISECLLEADRAEIVVSNIAGSGAGPVVVSEVTIDAGENEGFRIESESWYRGGSDGPLPFEYPLYLDPGDELHLTVSWCLALSNPPGGELAGTVDEHAVLRIATDDALTIPLAWMPEGCL